MSEHGESERVSERVLCPNCPADYPAPFSSRHITCRRCGTEFVAPDDARAPWRGTHGERWDSFDGPEANGRSKSPAAAIVDQFPTIALCLNALAVLLWASGTVSFEIAVLTFLLLTSAIVTERQ